MFDGKYSDETVQHIVEQFLCAVPKDQIVADLNHDDPDRAVAWSRTEVTRLLQSLVDGEQLDEETARLLRTRLAQADGVKPSKDLLAGKLICGACGTKMYGEAGRKKYICRSCPVPRPAIVKQDLNALVLEHLVSSTLPQDPQKELEEVTLHFPEKTTDTLSLYKSMAADKRRQLVHILIDQVIYDQTCSQIILRKFPLT